LPARGGVRERQDEARPPELLRRPAVLEHEGGLGSPGLAPEPLLGRLSDRPEAASAT